MTNELAYKMFNIPITITQNAQSTRILLWYIENKTDGLAFPSGKQNICISKLYFLFFLYVCYPHQARIHTFSFSQIKLTATYNNKKNKKYIVQYSTTK